MEPSTDFDDIAARPWAIGELQKGEVRAALEAFAIRFMLDYRRPVRFGFHADNEICGFGVALWLLGDHVGAAHVWANVCDAAYQGRIHYSSFGTFQSPLLLWFASVWLNNEDWHSQAKRTLAKLLGRRVPLIGSNFSSQLARILRQETTLAGIEAARLAETPPLVRKVSGHLSEHEEIMALFYEGVSAYENGDSTKTLDLWNRTPTPQEDGPLEYYLLMYEWKRLAPPVLRRSKKRPRN